jgi:hypothetical protein
LPFVWHPKQILKSLIDKWIVSLHVTTSAVGLFALFDSPSENNNEETTTRKRLTMKMPGVLLLQEDKNKKIFPTTII